ncbi:hypothetical protein J2X47_001965 [Sphingomonas sp. BE270]|jgi:hypothetical protein|uniref:hypothetical protein n=1 Tax=Sphingomonas sp. BE270 TaxID=2817726 RepID=UPI002859410C|nr:hypothetical protein [Sphingomonas sp. BE270]MDR7257785.1 hypothetical protein [Sphingomonas sp. BE270]
MRLVLTLAIAAIALTSCAPNSGAKPQSKTSSKPSAEFTSVKWTQVARAEPKYKIYVNGESIFPYKGMKMAEVAVFDGSEYTAYSLAYECDNRLFVRLGEDGSVTPAAPVQSFLLGVYVYNYVCFGTRQTDVMNEPTLAGIPVKAALNP